MALVVRREAVDEDTEEAKGMSQRDLWDELARRCWMSRGCVRRIAYLVCYGGQYDPWVEHIFRAEMAAMCVSLGHRGLVTRAVTR